CGRSQWDHQRRPVRHLAKALAEGTRMMKLFIAAGVVITVSVVNSGLAAAQTPDPKIQRGAAVYQNWCAPCHSSGRGNPGTAALAAKYKDRQPAVPAVLADRHEPPTHALRVLVPQGRRE